MMRAAPVDAASWNPDGGATAVAAQRADIDKLRVPAARTVSFSEKTMYLCFLRSFTSSYRARSSSLTVMPDCVASASRECTVRRAAHRAALPATRATMRTP